MLVLSAIYIVFNEGFANWQSLWFCALLVCWRSVFVCVARRPAGAKLTTSKRERQTGQSGIVEHDAGSAGRQRDAKQKQRRPDQVEQGGHQAPPSRTPSC